MDFVYNDNRVVEKPRAVAGQLLEFLRGDTVVVDEADAATRIRLGVPDELGDNLLADFRLLRCTEPLIIWSILLKVRHPDLLRSSDISLGESEDFNRKGAVNGILLL